jgi:hypothetical protein
MIPGFVDELNIKIMKQIMATNYIIIAFEIGEKNFGMWIKKIGDKFYPDNITHFPGANEKCKLCGKNVASCSVLNTHLDELFYYLIKSCELRLQWLYIPHERLD